MLGPLSNRSLPLSLFHLLSASSWCAEALQLRNTMCVCVCVSSWLCMMFAQSNAPNQYKSNYKNAVCMGYWMFSGESYAFVLQIDAHMR